MGFFQHILSFKVLTVQYDDLMPDNNLKWICRTRNAKILQHIKVSDVQHVYLLRQIFIQIILSKLKMYIFLYLIKAIKIPHEFLQFVLLEEPHFNF